MSPRLKSRTTASPDAREPSVSTDQWTSAKRTLVSAIAPVVGPLAAIVLVLASLVWVFADPRRRSVFDRTALTYVVTVRQQ